MYFRSGPGLLSLVLSLVLLAVPAAAQDSFLWIQGGFEDAFATDETFNSGGVIVVNGFNMTVPKNVLVQFPSAWVPFKDFAASKESFIGFETFVCASHTKASRVKITDKYPGSRKHYQRSPSCCSDSVIRVL